MDKGCYLPFSPDSVTLSDAELLRRRNENRAYLMRLDSAALLQNYTHEAGLYQSYGGDACEHRHGGWEDPFCELRGHFLGHWLSAAGRCWSATRDEEIRSKADRIIDILKDCQDRNGGEWVAAIPEKYLHWIAEGKAVWSPQYNIHKILMGLLDYYEATGNEKALLIADRFSNWFSRWCSSFDRKQFDDILDVETGGMLEVWAQLYGITGKEEHRALMEKYYRGRLFDALLRGEDVLTNMHANTTVPEALGAARAYEVTGDRKWLDVVLAYWDLAVTRRGTYVTGGQTSGEIWTPLQSLHLRLGDKNQEHCVVYNMMRLAEFLFRVTGDASYADYWERNLYNGIMAQAYWDGSREYSHGRKSDHPLKGLLTYFLPLRGGARKAWASETQDFFCCHGTLVQANAAHTDGIYYTGPDGMTICQYLDSSVRGQIGGTGVTVTQKNDPLTGTHLRTSSLAGAQRLGKAQIYEHDPNRLSVHILVEPEAPVSFALRLRVPSWVKEAPALILNGEPVPATAEKGFLVLDRVWDRDEIVLELQKEIRAVPLPGDESKVAFLNGPVVLAGRCASEQALYLERGQVPEALLEPFNEREWGIWKQTFQTKGQDQNITLVPLYQIGYEPYTVYFPQKQREK